MGRKALKCQVLFRVQSNGYQWPESHYPSVLDDLASAANDPSLQPDLGFSYFFVNGKEKGKTFLLAR